MKLKCMSNFWDCQVGYFLFSNLVHTFNCVFACLAEHTVFCAVSNTVKKNPENKMFKDMTVNLQGYGFIEVALTVFECTCLIFRRCPIFHRSWFVSRTHQYSYLDIKTESKVIVLFVGLLMN